MLLAFKIIDRQRILSFLLSFRFAFLLSFITSDALTRTASETASQTPSEAASETESRDSNAHEQSPHILFFRFELFSSNSRHQTNLKRTAKKEDMTTQTKKNARQLFNMQMRALRFINAASLYFSCCRVSSSTITVTVFQSLLEKDANKRRQHTLSHIILSSPLFLDLQLSSIIEMNHHRFSLSYSKILSFSSLVTERACLE